MSIATDDQRATVGGQPGASDGGNQGYDARTVAPTVYRAGTNGQTWGPGATVSHPRAQGPGGRANPQRSTQIVVAVAVALAVGLFAAHSEHAWPFAHRAAHPSQAAANPSPQPAPSPSPQPASNPNPSPSPSPQPASNTNTGTVTAAQLLPTDIDVSSDCEDGVSTAQSSGLGTGLVDAEACNEPNLSSGAVIVLQYDDSADTQQALQTFNGNKGFDPSTAGSSCPPDGSGEGVTSVSGQGGTVTVECFTTTSNGSTDADPMIVFSIPSANAFMIASTSSDWSTFSEWVSTAFDSGNTD
jgi:hypothetical protein